MSDKHDDKITELYRKASLETPPPHIDHAVMDMAQRAQRRRLFAPFGNQWLAGGATVAVVVLVVRWLGGMGAGPARQPGQKAPLDILEERFARGEIDKDEFEQRRDVLRS